MSTYGHVTQETTVCSSKEQALQFASGLDFHYFQAYRLWMEYPSREKVNKTAFSTSSSMPVSPEILSDLAIFQNAFTAPTREKGEPSLSRLDASNRMSNQSAEGLRTTVLLNGVPSAGWRIREIPDCASSPKTHKYNTENEKWNQINSSRAISKSCAIPGCPWRLAAMMPCW